MTTSSSNDTVPIGVLSSGISGPVDLAIDAGNNLYVANYYGNNVEEFSSGGALANTFSASVTNPLVVAVDRSGDVFTTNYYYYYVGMQGNAANPALEFSQSGALLRDLPAASAIAADPSGNILVAMPAGTAEKLSPTGSVIWTSTDGIYIPVCIASDPNGNIYVANTDNTVVEFSPSGVLLHTLTGNDGISTPVGLAFDAQGDLYVANSATQGHSDVLEFSPAGVLTATFSAGVAQADSVAVDKYGHVYISNYGNDSVTEYAADGTLLRTLSQGVDKPYSVATDSNGNVFVANYGNNTITEYAADTSAAGSAGGTAAGIPQATFQNLFGANTGLDFIYALDASGLTLSQAAAEITSGQAQELVAKFGADPDFLAFLNGHAAIPQAIYQSLTSAATGLDFVYAFEASGLTLSQAAVDLVPSQTQAILAKFGADPDFLAFLNGDTGLSPAQFLPLINAGSGIGFVHTFEAEGLTLAQVSTELLPGQIAQIVAKFDTDPNFLAFAEGTSPTAPTVTGGAASALIYAGSTAQLAGASVSDAYAATSQIQVVLSDAHGLLSVTPDPGAGLQISGESSNSLSLTGTLAVINAALATLTDHNTVAGSDNISIVATDLGTGLQASATESVSVNAAVAPSVTSVAQTLTTGTETAAGSSTWLIGGISISDPSALSGNLQVVLSDAHGLLSVTPDPGAGLQISGGSSNSLSLTGTLAVINAALATLTDLNTTTGSDNIGVAVTDLGSGLTASATVPVSQQAPAPVAPTIAVASAQTILASSNPFYYSADAISGISIADPSAGTGSITVTLTDAYGHLSVTPNPGAGLQISGASSNSLSLTGTLTVINAALATLTDYNGTLGADNIAVAVTDHGSGLTAGGIQLVGVVAHF